MRRRCSQRFRVGAAGPLKPQWERLGTREPRSSDREVGVHSPEGGRLWKIVYGRPGGGQAAAAEWTSLFQQMPGGWGAQRRGLEQGAYSTPLHPSRGTALKSCGVCHRPASPRMRIGEVEFFLSFLPPSLSLSSRLWFFNLKKKFFFPSKNSRGKRSPERGRESEAVG